MMAATVYISDGFKNVGIENEQKSESKGKNEFE